MVTVQVLQVTRQMPRPSELLGQPPAGRIQQVVQFVELRNNAAQAGQIWTVAGVKCLQASAHFNNFVPTVCQLPVVPAPVPAPAPPPSPAAKPALLWSLLPVTVFWLAHSWSIFCFYATAATLTECGQEGVNGHGGGGGHCYHNVLASCLIEGRRTPT